MKRLMLLGGNRYQLPVIKAAHELGCYVITCDYLPDNIAHRYSDQYCNVSITEKEEVLAAARELDIAGIMSFGCDPGVTTAAYVAEKLGLPSAGSYDSVSILQDKGKFRKFLEDNGFRVPVAKKYSRLEDASDDLALFHWPVIVKPTDSAGSKGVSRVDTREELPAAIRYALDHSLKKEFIIEDFLEKVGCPSDSDCFSVNGKFEFISFSSQRFDEQADNPYTPSTFSWPSTLTKEQEEELAAELQRLIGLLGLKTSLYNIETRVCADGKAYIMECSPRGGGNRLSEMLKYITGVDLIRAAVRAAIGEDVGSLQPRPVDGHWAEIILHSDANGIYDSLWIHGSIRDKVVEKDVWVEPGDHISGFSGANQSIGTLVLRFDDEKEMLEVVDNVRDYVRVISREQAEADCGR